MEHAFHGSGPRYTLGVEEELMIVDGEQFDLVNAIESLLEDAADGEIKPELMESVLEIATKPCRDTAEVAAQLRSLRAQVARTAGARDLRIGSAGTHPFAMWEDQRIVARPRYRDLISDLRYVARQELVFGLHVHVGIDDPEKAIHVANGMRVHVPVLLALSANSPFWRADRTGLMSTRTPIFRAFPRVGIPPRYEGWDHYCREIDFMVRSGAMEDYTYLWYDVRPHPRLGTVEIRVCDAQTRVEHTVALAALIQAMVKELCEHHEQGGTLGDYPWQMLDENKWLAARHGLDGDLVATGSRRSSSPVASWSACAVTPRTSDPRATSRGSRTCSSAATAPPARSSSTRRTRTSARSWRRSSRRRCPPREGPIGAPRRPRRPTRVESIAMSSGGPDLFVVCKSCGSEVSPYITECPYCGQRLRKRAPKIERDSGGEAKPPKAPRQAKARRPDEELDPLEQLMGLSSQGETPGRGRRGRAKAPKPPKRPKAPKPPRRPGRARSGGSSMFHGDEFRRPTVTIALIAISAIGAIVFAALDRGDAALVGPLAGEWWRVVSTLFLYDNRWYQFAAVLAIGVFGWRLEKRHGPMLVFAIFAACAGGGTAVAAVAESFPVALGGIGGGLGLLAAWAVPVMRARKRTGDDDDDADLLGAFVIGAVLALMPIATPDANAIAAAVGLLLGGAGGLMLDRVAPRDG
jgi:carboxylate-amine ligase